MVSQKEMRFIQSVVENGLRIDTRNFPEKREQFITEPSEYASSLCDRSVKITRGYSQLSLSFTFNTSFEAPCKLLLTEEYDKAKDESEEPNFLKTCYNKPNPCFEKINSFLKNYEICLLVESYVIRDDGNIMEMFFDGLRHVFSSIHVPDLHNLHKPIEAKLELPKCTSYAIFGSKIVTDPTLIEETSADGTLHVFDDEKSCILFTGSISVDNLSNILSNF